MCLNEIKGKINKLEWDSNFFEFEVAKVSTETKEVLQKILKNNFNLYNLIYVFSEIIIAEPILHKYNGLLVDNKVTLEKLVNNVQYTSRIQEYPKGSICKELESLSLESGIYSRYKVDQRLPIGSFEKMYKIWIWESVNFKLADKVFVYYREGLIVGFITIKIRNKYGEIGLIAVDIKHRGKNIGKQLINRVELYLYKKGVKYLRVSTQRENTSALKFYKKLNFTENKSMYIYHFLN